MLTLNTLRLLDRMPAPYRDAIDRRCRAASGYDGKRPTCDERFAWEGGTDEIERLTTSVANLDAKLANIRSAWTG